MPFLSRRRSALEFLNANLRERDKEFEDASRPRTPGLVPSSRPPPSARPVSMYGSGYTSSRLSHEVHRDDISDGATRRQANRRSKRLSMLKLRNFSESQLSVRAQREALDEDEVPPLPSVPRFLEAPAIVRTAPTTDANDRSSAERKPSRSPFKRSTSRKRVAGQNTYDTHLEEMPRISVDGRDSQTAKRPSLRWRKWQGRSTGLEDLIHLSAANTGNKSEAPPAYGEDNQTELALPHPRFSESSRSDGSRGSSGDHIYAATTTTHSASTHTTFFKLPRRNKNRNSLFPLPVKIAPRDELHTSHSHSAAQHSPNAQPAHGRHSFSAQRPPLMLHRTNSSSSPSKRNTILAPNSQPPVPFHPQAQSLVRHSSQRSRKSSNSSPLQPPMRLAFRERASTTSSLGRGSVDTPPLLTGSTRNSTSTTGRSSLGGFLGLSRFRHDSDSHSPRHDSSGNRSKSNSFALSREALVVPEREEGDTPGKYLERLESAVSRSLIAGILSQSSDPFAQSVLRSYTRRFPFFGEPIDMSLRKFLLEAELPKETQQVDRVIQAFADRYHECNPGVFMAPDQAYIIAFSLMMLHTDAFNKNNKRKMQKHDYIKNTAGQRVSDDVLACFYDNICYTPFVHYEEEVDINGDRVLPSKAKKNKVKAPPNEAGKKPSGPVDPYNLLVDQKLDMLRPSIKDSIILDDPYSCVGSQGPRDVQYLQRAFSHTGVLQIISARSRPTAYEGQVNAANPTLVETQAGIIDLKITKVGTLWRKATKRKKARSPWQEWGAILTGSQLYLFKNAHWAKTLVHQFVSHQRHGQPRIPVVFKPPLQEFKPDALIKTDDAVALIDNTYNRHKHAFTFVRHGGQEETFLADNDTERNDWLALINYAAAFRAAGVRIRGMVGVNETEARPDRRPSTTSNGSVPAASAEITSHNRDLTLQKQVMAARRQIMVQKIAEADRDITQMLVQLGDMVRDARHLMVLAPLAQRSRDEIIHAAARADANIKWLRRDIWRIKSYRDILSLDAQQDGLSASELAALTEGSSDAERANNDRELNFVNAQLGFLNSSQSPTSGLTALSRRATVREVVDEYVDDVFRMPRDSSGAPEGSESWRLPPLQLDVDERDRQQRRISIDETLLSAPSLTSPQRPALSQRSSLSTQRPEPWRSQSATEDVRATSPTSLIAEDESEGTPKEFVTPEKTVTRASEANGSRALDLSASRTAESNGSRALNVDGASPTPDASKPKAVRRSLQKTLREVQHHQPTIHRHRRAKESESTTRSAGDANDIDLPDGTPSLERAKGRFILHGKQASVIEFGEDWPKERMKMRQDNVKRGPQLQQNGSTARGLTSDSVPHSPIVQDFSQHDETDGSLASSNTSGAQSFVESAETAQAFSELSPALLATNDADVDSDDDEPTFYDLSTWDPNTGKRDTILGPMASGRSEEPIAELDATQEVNSSSPMQEFHDFKTYSQANGTADDGEETKTNRRTVIGPSIPVHNYSNPLKRNGVANEEADEGEIGGSLLEHIDDDDLRGLAKQHPAAAAAAVHAA